MGAAMGAAGEAGAGGADRAKEAFALARAQATTIADALKEATAGQATFNRSIAEGNKGLASFSELGAKTAASFGKAMSGAAAGSFAGITAGLTELAGTAAKAFGPLGIFAGAVTAAVGAAAGVKLLASAAVDRQRSAFEMGLKPGQVTSFGINQQQFGTEAGLAAAAHAQVDARSGGFLTTLGLDFNSVRNIPATELWAKGVRAAALASKASPSTPLEQLPQVVALEQLGFGDSGTVRNVLEEGLPRFDDATRRTAAAAGRFNFGKRTGDRASEVDKWADSLGAAGQTAAIRLAFGANGPAAKVIAAFSSAEAVAAAALGGLAGALNSAAGAAANFGRQVNGMLPGPVRGALDPKKHPIPSELHRLLHKDLGQVAQHWWARASADGLSSDVKDTWGASWGALTNQGMGGAPASALGRGGLSASAWAAAGLTPKQATFASEFVKKTGLDPAFVGAWVRNEGGSSLGDANFLNVGHPVTGAWDERAAWRDPVRAADMTLDAIEHHLDQTHGIPDILKAKGAEAQARALKKSNWAESHYNAWDKATGTWTGPDTLIPVVREVARELATAIVAANRSNQRDARTSKPGTSLTIINAAGADIFLSANAAAQS